MARKRVGAALPPAPVSESTAMTDARAFRGFHFPVEVVLWAVRWYLQFPVSYRVDQAIADKRGRFHFSSFIRCTVARLDPKEPDPSKQWKGTGGGMLDKFVAHPPAYSSS